MGEIEESLAGGREWNWDLRGGKGGAG
jgi:hypothetical protein